MNLYFGYYYFLILSALGYGLMTVRRRSPIQYRLLLWWLVVTVLTEAAARVVAQKYHDNHWVYIFFEPFDSFMILLMCYYGMKHRITRRASIWLMAVILLAAIVFTLPHLLKLAWNVKTMLFYLFFDLIAACIFLIDCFMPGEEEPVFKRPLSWLALGICIYSSMYILLHALWAYIPLWPVWVYSLLSAISNTFEYAGVLLTLYALRRSRIKAG